MKSIIINRTDDETTAREEIRSMEQQQPSSMSFDEDASYNVTYVPSGSPTDEEVVTCDEDDGSRTVPTMLPGIHRSASGSLMSSSISRPMSPLSNQSFSFEEHIGKPSRDALHKFFYTADDERALNNSNSNNDDEVDVPQEESRTAPFSPASHPSLDAIPELPMSTSDKSNTNSRKRRRVRRRRQQRYAGLQGDVLDLESDAPTEDHVVVSNLEESSDSEEKVLIEQFWKWYDDIVILSLFAILGIIFRISAATWFSNFGDTFNENSALFTNLPLNCLSCFLMGLLCSGNDAIHVVYTRLGIGTHYNKRDDATYLQRGGRLTPPHTSTTGLHCRREEDPRPNPMGYSQQRLSAEDELREVQLLALERRIRSSRSLVLFPAKKEDVDVMEHYFDGEPGQRLNDLELLPTNTTTTAKVCQHNSTLHLQNDDSWSNDGVESFTGETITASGCSPTENYVSKESPKQASGLSSSPTGPAISEPVTLPAEEQQRDLDQILTDAAENLKRLVRVNVADGWDVGTTAEAMSDDLLLGLRVGFCGAVSTFSSWNSDMVNLIRGGHVSKAVVGYMIGIQLPIVAYRFGQHVAVYIFVWRCQRETRKDERRGYGIRLHSSDDDDDSTVDNNNDIAPEDHRASDSSSPRIVLKSRHGRRLTSGGRILDEKATTRETPSVRAIATAIFALTFMMLVTSLIFFDSVSVQKFSISLLFTPCGVLARWKLSKFNTYLPGFPLGTFTCNVVSCALSGSLGVFLAGGNPGPEESVILVSMMNGFAGSLSTLATFLIEVLAGIDPILFRFDGIQYCFVTIVWGIIIGLFTRQAKNWADEL